MPDPITLTALTLYVAKNAPSWLASLRGTLLDKGRESAIDMGKEYALTKGKPLVRQLLHLDEKEQLRHLQQALKNATERGLATFDTLQERDQYKDILHTLSQPGPQGDVLRKEIMQVFTLSDTPDLAKLNDLYNQRLRFSHAAHQDIDAAPYLARFFNALLKELYEDPYFKQQLSSTLQLRATTSMQQSLLDIVNLLKDNNTILQDKRTAEDSPLKIETHAGQNSSQEIQVYTGQDLARDIEIYTAHIERTLHNLKIVGVVPKDQNSDPELNGIFVPLRIASNKQEVPFAYIDAWRDETNFQDDQVLPHPPLSTSLSPNEQQQDALTAALEQSSCLVLLGGPGSGKSTATKYLAWSHAAANQSTHSLLPSSLLTGSPLPLRIELRRLSEERKRANYDFLSFVTQVLLQREGVEINPQMFKELLTRRGMLLLFDGLDEVATLDERHTLVEEIEHFALAYPGNRMLVTSRPVGYELTRISHPLFSHSEVQGFDDGQIQQFLNNWYTAVLRLSPIPQREQEELDLLLTTLQENSRLHKLAENPLLLTVITVLHRYERLPDRRVLVYDRCADLLLETWARLKGTNIRWKDLRMGKEDQYACVAFLGFVLHQRSQEEMTADSNNKEPEEETVDVSSRFLRTNVENFLRKQKSIVGGAELRAEAARFIALIQEEAGLIVERGTDENGEALYSFVHRTFQEYFAAADIYERYQQKEDPKVISKFLVEHLHDPHWREVIFLLLGKLKSTPVTKQLRDILQGKTKSRRSNYTNIVQQDLFFVCDCLLEEIKVESALVETVRSELGKVVKSSSFPEQRQEAFDYIRELAQTRQYAEYGRKELLALATNNALDGETRLKAAQFLYIYTPKFSEERLQADRILTTLVQSPELPVEQVRASSSSLYARISAGLEGRELAVRMLSELVQRSDLSIEQTRETAEFLYTYSPDGSEGRELAMMKLKGLMERADVSVEQVREMAKFLYMRSSDSLEGRELAVRILSELVQRSDLSIEQMWKAAEFLYTGSPNESEAQKLAERKLIELVQRPDLSVEQVREMATSLYTYSPDGSEGWEVAIRILSGLIERADALVEQVRETAEYLYDYTSDGSEGRKLAVKMLSRLMKRPDMSMEQVRKTVDFLYPRSIEGSGGRELAVRMLRKLVQRPGLSVEQVRETAESLYVRSPNGSEGRELVMRMLRKLVQRPGLSIEQMWKATEFLYSYSPNGSEAQELAERKLSDLVQRPDLSVEQVREMAISLYNYSSEGSEAEELAIRILNELMQRSDLSVEQMLEMAKFLYRSSIGSKARQLAMRELRELVQRSDLSVEQMRETAEFLYNYSPDGSEAEELVGGMLSRLMERSDLSVEQMWKAAESLYKSSPAESKAGELAGRLLRELVQRSDLSVEQVRETAASLYNYGRAESKDLELVVRMLRDLMERSGLSIEQRRETAESLYDYSPEGSEAKLLATSSLLALLSDSDGLENKGNMYEILRTMVPQFRKLPPIVRVEKGK